MKLNILIYMYVTLMGQIQPLFWRIFQLSGTFSGRQADHKLFLVPIIQSIQSIQTVPEKKN
jgi:hypothetical protein